MSFRDAQTLESAIDSTYKEALRLADENQFRADENQSRLVQLMTIWVSGYLEVTCRDVLLTYTERNSDEAVARFVSQNLQRMRSPNAEQILNLVRSFDEDRAKELKEFFHGRIKESVDGVVALRNKIAHGGTADTTIANVKTQFDDSKQLAAKLKELFAVAA